MLLKHLKKGIGFFLILSVIIFVSKTYSQEIPGTAYIVKQGDTLWGISSSHYTDPFLWPKVWGKNSSVPHPDRIYPGQKIFLPSEEFLKQAEKSPPVIETEQAPEKSERQVLEETNTEEITPASEKSDEPLPFQPEFSEPAEEIQAFGLAESDLITGGFILKTSSADGKVGQIIASEHQHLLLGEGDVVYISPVSSHSFHIGDRYTIYQAVKSIRHPKTHRLMGNLIHVKGFIEIIPNQMSNSGQETFSARIIKSFELINLRDSLMSYRPVNPDDLSLPQIPYPKEIKGTVVGARDFKENNGQYDFVYLDRGSRDGLQPGHLFVVFKEGEKVPFYSPDGRQKLPRRIIAYLEVISVQQETSTAIVENSIEPIVVGDQVSNPPPKP